MRLRTKSDRKALIEEHMKLLAEKPGFEKLEDKNHIGGIYEGSSVRPYAITLYKKWSTKPLLHNYVNSKERALELYEKYKERQKAWDKRKEERKQIAKKNDLKVGDILYSSWGYDQTNIDFFQVVEKKGAQTVVIRPIASKVVETTGWCSDMVVAVKDAFIESPIYDSYMTKRVSDNSVKLKSYSWAWLWDGEPKNETSYA